LSRDTKVGRARDIRLRQKAPRYLPREDARRNQQRWNASMKNHCYARYLICFSK